MALTDPAFNAFQAANQLNAAQATASAARRAAAIQSALGLSQEDILARGEQARRQIRGGQEARGVFRSGQTLQRVSEQQAGEGRQLGGGELGAANQLAGIQEALASQLLGGAIRTAEQGITTRDRLARQQQQPVFVFQPRLAGSNVQGGRF